MASKVQPLKPIRTMHIAIHLITIIFDSCTHFSSPSIFSYSKALPDLISYKYWIDSNTLIPANDHIYPGDATFIIDIIILMVCCYPGCGRENVQKLLITSISKRMYIHQHYANPVSSSVSWSIFAGQWKRIYKEYTYKNEEEPDHCIWWQ